MKQREQRIAVSHRFHGGPTPRLAAIGGGVVAAVLFAVALGAGLGAAGGSRTAVGTRPGAGMRAQTGVAAAAPVPVLTVGSPAAAPSIKAGFLGLGLEYTALERYDGTSPQAPNPVFEQLVRNLAPSWQPVLRIGGDTTDWTWWPVGGMATPPWVRFDLGPAWVAVVRGLVHRVGARLLLGINLEAASRTIAGTEARALLRGLGRSAIAAFELGNEPELYRGFTWYSVGDRHVRGRPPSYTFDDFTREFRAIGDALPRVPLAGPVTGGTRWPPDLGRWLAATPAARLVTVHAFPLQQCYVAPQEAKYPTIGHLLSPVATTGLADSVAGKVRTAHARGVPLRVAEMNTVGCGDAPHVANTFAAALWALETLFEMARVGVDGVNVQTYPGAPFELFHITRSAGGRWRASVAPEYYGLLMFVDAAPPGSRLLRLRTSSDPKLRAWATLGRDGIARVVLVNAGQHTHAISVSIAGVHGAAALERLSAPGLAAERGVTLGGRNFGVVTHTGALAPRRTAAVTPDAGRYRVSVPPASAALLAIPAH